MKFLLRTALIFFLFTSLLLPQTLTETEQLEAWLTIFKHNRGDVLFPNAYRSLSNRIDSLKHRESLQTGSNDSIDPETYFFLSKELIGWIESAKTTSETLAPLLTIRDRVATMGAEDFATEVFGAGEATLQEAAKSLQVGKRRKGQELSKQAEQFYHRAEYTCIRNNLLGEIRILIQESLDKKADKIAPRTFSSVQSLLATVEELVKSQGSYSEALSQKSQELRTQANHLYDLVHTLQPIYQSQEAGESFLLDMEQELKTLAEQVEDTAMKRAVGFQNLLEVLRARITELSSENKHLLSRNQLLENEKQDLEKALLRNQYGNFDARQSLLEQKINRAQKLLGSDRVEEQGSFLIIYLDSLDHLFDNHSQISTINNEARLTVLLEALSEFADNPIYLRYIKYSYDNLVFSNTLASQRVEALKSHIQSFPAFQSNNKLYTAAFVYQPEQPQDLSRDVLEIRIDLKAYLSSGNKQSIRNNELLKRATE